MSKHHTQSEETVQDMPQTEEKPADEGVSTQAEGQNDPEIKEQETEAAAKPLTPEEKIAELEAQLAETRDQLLRKAADFENFRKRINQEKQSAIEYANQSLLLDIIPIIDDFERAIQAGEGSSDLTAFLDGVKMKIGRAHV